MTLIHHTSANMKNAATEPRTITLMDRD